MQTRTQIDSCKIGVYLLCTPSGKCYVGMTCDSFDRRWAGHLKELRRGVHKSPGLTNAYVKYGWDAIEKTILEEWQRPEDGIELVRLQEYILKRERYWWEQLYTDGVEMLHGCPTGTGSVLHTRESKEKLSRTLKSKIFLSDEEKKTIERTIVSCTSWAEVKLYTGFSAPQLKLRKIELQPIRKKKELNEKTCTVCGKSFSQSKSSRRKTCSEKCMNRSYNRHYSYPNEQTLKDLRNEGKSLAQIASIYGCSRQTIWKLVKNYETLSVSGEKR